MYMPVSNKIPPAPFTPLHPCIHIVSHPPERVHRRDFCSESYEDRRDKELIDIWREYLIKFKGDVGVFYGQLIVLYRIRSIVSQHLLSGDMRREPPCNGQPSAVVDYFPGRLI